MGRRRGRRLRHAGTGTGRLLGIGVGETVERGVVVAIAIVVRDFRHTLRKDGVRFRNNRANIPKGIIIKR